MRVCVCVCVYTLIYTRGIILYIYIRRKRQYPSICRADIDSSAASRARVIYPTSVVYYMHYTRSILHNIHFATTAAATAATAACRRVYYVSNFCSLIIYIHTYARMPTPKNEPTATKIRGKQRKQIFTLGISLVHLKKIKLYFTSVLYITRVYYTIRTCDFRMIIYIYICTRNNDNDH